MTEELLAIIAIAVSILVIALSIRGIKTGENETDE
jgi:hypothetical protein